jgi:hypothetical protein
MSQGDGSYRNNKNNLKMCVFRIYHFFWVWWNTHIFPATQEAEIRRLTVHDYLRQKVSMSTNKLGKKHRLEDPCLRLAQG